MPGRSSARPVLPTKLGEFRGGEPAALVTGRVEAGRSRPRVPASSVSKIGARSWSTLLRHCPPTSTSISGRRFAARAGHDGRLGLAALRPLPLPFVWPLRVAIGLAVRVDLGGRRARSASAASAGPGSPARRPPSSPPGCRPPRSSSRRTAAGRPGTAAPAGRSASGSCCYAPR